MALIRLPRNTAKYRYTWIWLSNRFGKSLSLLQVIINISIWKALKIKRFVKYDVAVNLTTSAIYMKPTVHV